MTKELTPADGHPDDLHSFTDCIKDITRGL
jgi:hypothetical protein